VAVKFTAYETGGTFSETAYGSTSLTTNLHARTFAFWVTAVIANGFCPSSLQNIVINELSWQ
jgi:hypothetical protein